MSFNIAAQALATTLLVLGGLATNSAVLAQGYPSKPVRVIVQFPPGGTPDIYGRVMAAELTKVWNQTVVVENRVGAGGAIGTDAVAKSTADGYTLLFAADAPITVSPNLVKVPYDPIRDLTPIVNVAQGAFVLLAHPSVPAKNVPELIALVKSQPGKWSYASSGAGSQQHLSMEWIRTSANLDMTHVPYKGFGQGVADVMAGQVPIIFGGITAAIGLHRGGKLKALGVTSKARHPAIPDIAAIAEAIPGYEILAWYGFMGPAGMPRDIVQKINADVIAIINRPDFRERLAKDAIAPVGNTPEQFAEQVKTDLAVWSKIVKASGAKVE
jgi:tripartite-type tricarboxylate transporter receptor subunit TctC